MAHGALSQAEHLLQHSRGGTILNTAFTLRLNGTFRERLASLTRKSRHAAHRLRALETGMYLICLRRTMSWSTALDLCAMGNGMPQVDGEPLLHSWCVDPYGC
jgi:hypothetical protein